jgi:hypothetical protein
VEDIMLDSRVRHLVAAAGLLFVVPSFCCGDGPDEKSAGQLKREVEERERQLTWAQRGLAEARARLALAEGKRESAITELRKAVACCHGEVRWIRGHANWFCDPREPMDKAQWDLAKDRAWLADVEGDSATLVAEWKKIVGFHEQHLKSLQRLEQLRAVNSADVTVVQQALDKDRQRLEAAEKRLSAEQSKNAQGSK